jgi:hypothetical protein
MQESAGLERSGQVAFEDRETPLAGDAGLLAEGAVPGFFDEAPRHQLLKDARSGVFGQIAFARCVAH